MSAQLAVEVSQEKVTKTLDELLFNYLWEYKDIFKKKATERFSSSRRWDHGVELKSDFAPKDCKVYPLSPVEREELELDKFLDENLGKQNGQPSKSPMALLFFFVQKKDRSLWPVQDYRHLKDGTVKNAYLFLLDQLKGLKYFTKLNIHAG